VLVSSRSYREYAAMFDLDRATVDGLVVDCGSGASSFVAELSARGGAGVAVDPVYAHGLDTVRRSAAESLLTGTAIVGYHADRFVWDWYGSPARRERMRIAAAERFLDDIALRPSAYVAGELPHLPLSSGSADLVLSSHLLFTWADRLGYGWHRAALAELVRVTRREVRVFPLVVQATGAVVPFLDRLVDELRSHGHDVAIRDVPYQFQRGAHAMLVVRRVPRQRGVDGPVG
jgi:SAM-dependent methyltransferase